MHLRSGEEYDFLIFFKHPTYPLGGDVVYNILCPLNRSYFITE